MKITFDPHNPEDVAAVQAFLGDTPAPAKPVVSNGNISDSPEDRVDPNDIPTVDCHGMEWNSEIHAETKALNNDGSWKVRRGKAAEAKAAIEAFEKQQVQETRAATEEPASAGMPGVGMPSMPSPEPEIPEPVIEFQQLVERFTGMMESGAIKDWSVAYAKAGVANADDLETNESLRRVLWNILDDVETNGWDAVFAS